MRAAMKIVRKVVLGKKKWWLTGQEEAAALLRQA